jgi:hypothetical protein
MNTLTKIAAAALLAGSFASATAAPADAGVIVRVGVGIPAGPVYVPSHGFCFYHPAACAPRPGYVQVAAPVYIGGYADGFYLAGRGYWHEGRFWGHREWFHGGWRFR